MPLSKYLASTFSIIAHDPEAQEWGVAVQSKAFAVGSMVPSAQAGVGAIASQAWTNKSFGARGLALLKRGHDPKDVIQHLIAGDNGGARRQLAVLDAQGRAANYTGNECMKWAGGIAEQNVSVQGNILASERVITNMLRAFKNARGKLGERLIVALEAGQKAGGDTRGQQAASLLIVREKSDIDGIGDVYVDLRVDDHKTPLAELRRLYGVWEIELYPYLEGDRVNALLREKRYARAQKLHRDFSAHAARLARKNWNDAQLLNVLAWQFAQNPLGLDAAQKYAQRASKLKPRDTNIADTLAEVYFQRGDTTRAIELERPLVAKNPNRSDLKAQLEKFEKAARKKRRK
ncbi:MAG: DUF1028 domain-containing protein [Chloroflexota bacterium]|nr:MAG: DUF1028 domain-containing protein [Chloroflexota bacterium]